MEEQGGEIDFNKEVKSLDLKNSNIECVTVIDSLTGEKEEYRGDIVFSTMPVKDLIGGMVGDVPDNVRYVAENLPYRDFTTVGLLLEELKIKNDTSQVTHRNLVPDN